VPQRQQDGDPAGLLRAQQVDRVSPVGGGPPRGERRPRAMLACRAAQGDPLFEGEVGGRGRRGHGATVTVSVNLRRPRSSGDSPAGPHPGMGLRACMPASRPPVLAPTAYRSVATRARRAPSWAGNQRSLWGTLTRSRDIAREMPRANGPRLRVVAIAMAIPTRSVVLEPHSVTEPPASTCWGTRSGRTSRAQTNTATRARLTIVHAVRANSTMSFMLSRTDDTPR
jgi:hypothetical protein